MRTIFLIFIAVFANHLCASEISILRVHCDPEFESMHDFILQLDHNDNVAQMLRISPNSKSLFYNHQLQRGDVVIASFKGKNVIVLSCPNYHPTKGGYFIVKYLYNALTNSYKSMPLVLEKNRDRWELYTPPPRKQKVSALRVVPRTIAGVPIGVKHLQVVHY